MEEKKVIEISEDDLVELILNKGYNIDGFPGRQFSAEKRKDTQVNRNVLVIIATFSKI